MSAYQIPCLVDYTDGRLLLTLEEGDQTAGKVAQITVEGYRGSEAIDFTMEFDRAGTQCLYDELGKLLRKEPVGG